MSVSDGPGGRFGSPTNEPLLLDSSLPAEAASELAQELTLVAGAMFAQLLPGSAARALAGVPGLVESHRLAAVEVPATRAVLLPTQPHPPHPPAEEPAEPVAAGTPAPHDAVSPPAPAPADPATPTSVPLPPVAVPTVPLVEIPVASEVVPLVGIPVTAAMLDASTDAATDPSEPHAPKADPRSMLMLDEIAFLDEED